MNGGKALPDDLLTIARTIQYVDDNPKTLPSFNPIDSESRRTFHFPTSGTNVFNYSTVKRNSSFAKHNVNLALQANNPLWLGMALHTYLDSYAHEGYGPALGQIANAMDADRPNKNPAKFREMSRYLYAILTKWQQNNARVVGPTKITGTMIENWASYAPLGYTTCAGWVKNPFECSTYKYENDEVAPRVAYWKERTNENFPGLELTYAQLTGQQQTDFEALIAKYIMPTDEASALQIEWSGIQKAAKARAVSSNVVANAVDPRLENNIPAMAKAVLLDPRKFPEGVPQKLTTKKGTAALLKNAESLPDGWFNLSVLLGSGDGAGSAFKGYNNKFIGLLGSKKVDARLFALSMLSGPQNVKNRAICSKSNGVLSKISLSDLSVNQKGLLLKTMVPDSYWMSQCATNALPLLYSLLDDKDLGGVAAATAYKIVEDKSSDLEHVEDQSGLLAMRDLRDGISDTLYNKIIIGAQNTNLSPAVREDQAYWALRSREDLFDNAVDTSINTKHINELADALIKARNDKRMNLVSGIASALATYDVSDRPGVDLIAQLKSLLADPEFSSVRLEIGYALEKLSGTTQPLSSYLQ